MRTRIILVIIIVSAIGMLSVGVAVYFVERARILDQIDERLAANLVSARFIVGDEQPGWESSLAALESVVMRMSPDDNTGVLGIVAGAPALVPGISLDVDLQRDPDFVEMVAGITGTEPTVGTFAEGDVAWRYLSVPLSVPGTADAGQTTFVMAYDLNAELAEIDGAARMYLTMTAIVIAVIAGSAGLVAARLLRPLRTMRETAELITAHSLSERLPVTGRDDVSELATTMNDMLDRLDNSLDSQRQLLSDVGHELKTPITIVRGYLEVVDVDDPADIRDTLALAVDELDRMGQLVQDLAGAAALHGPEPIHPRPVDAADLVTQIVRKAAIIDGAQVVQGATADVATDLDPARITQAMLQLAQNGVTHGGGRLIIGSTVRDGMLQLSVRDFGPGVPDDAKKRVFERFQRGQDEGRGPSGSGLGLNIVDVIARAHGGTAAVRDADGIGAEFVIALPLTQHEKVDSGESPSLESLGLSTDHRHIVVPPRPPLPLVGAETNRKG